MKGLKKIDANWADIPMNPQAVQLFQSAQSQQNGGDMGAMDGAPNDAGNEDSWGDYGSNVMGEDAERGDFDDADNGENAEETPQDDMQKSLSSQAGELVRIRI